MNLTEKAAYLKGLVEGIDLDDKKPETKILKAVLDLLDDLALSVSDLDDEVAGVIDQLDAVDEDLADLEEIVYEDYDEYDDCDCDCCDDELYEIECPACQTVFSIDEECLEDGSIDCPNCGELLEFDIDCDCCDDE
ncbi:MAG: hypothetical protein IJM97_00715 [Clostridia bacterium]|nr:hypothetical protein [Clostridia bacterium]MBQ6707449.1 hypothetical protein [Clostridia bacterium]